MSLAVYIPAPRHTAAADACLQLAVHAAEAYADRNPDQPLAVSALFAGHYTAEGIAALQEAGELPPFYYHVDLLRSVLKMLT